MRRSRDTVLVTGGAGFIGSELSAQLVASGRPVVMLDNLATGRRDNVSALPASEARLVIGDVRHRDLLASLLADVSVVFHLACVNLRRSIVAPREAHDVNATATLDLLDAARRAGVERVVYVSSSEVYGSAQSVPMAEDHPTQPTTVYGASKLAGEAYARAFWETHAFPTVVVRPFNSFGPRSHHEGANGEVIPRFLLRALTGRPLVVFGDGSQTRDFTEVSDTARGILLAGLSDEGIGRTINIGTGRELSLIELARAVARVVGRTDVHIAHVAARPGDVQRQCADATVARRLFGFAPRMAFEDGLSRLREWYRAHHRSAEQLLEEEVLRSWESGPGHAVPRSA